MRHTHQWKPLFREPAYTVERALQAIFEHHSDYVECDCGQIGRKIHSNRGGVRLLNGYEQSRLHNKATDWLLAAPEAGGEQQ